MDSLLLKILFDNCGNLYLLFADQTLFNKILPLKFNFYRYKCIYERTKKEFARIEKVTCKDQKIYRNLKIFRHIIIFSILVLVKLF